MFTVSELPAKLVEGLGAEDFKERVSSQEQLLEWAKTQNDKHASFALFKLSKESSDPEVRQRCMEVLRGLSDQDYLTHGKGFLGISMSSESVKLPDQEKLQPAIRITRIVKDSPADRSGLVVDDMIIALDGKGLVGDPPHEAFRIDIAAMKPQDKVALRVKRASGEIEIVKVTLTRHPGDDVPGFPQSMELLDERARQQHFELWLKEVEKRGD